MDFDVNRFIKAQNYNGVYERALSELKNGKKQTHWMWFIFPQLKELGRSDTALFYGVSGLDEAKEFWNNTVLRERYLTCCEALASVNQSDPIKILGRIDAQKLRSSLTLFSLVDDIPEINLLLDKFFGGQKDEKTISLIKSV